MIHFEIPLSLIIDDFIVVTNIFYTYDYIYIISVNYKAENNDVTVRNAFGLKFKLNDNDIEHENLFQDSGSADRFSIFKITNPNNKQSKKLTIMFEQNTYDYNLTENNYVDNTMHNLSLMTLFKHDYKLLPSYIKHYKNLGVK